MSVNGTAPNGAVASDAILLHNGDSFIGCNQAALAMFGCASFAEFAAHPANDFFPLKQSDGKNSEDSLDEKFAKTRETGRSRFPWIYIRTTGKTLYATVKLDSLIVGGQECFQFTIHNTGEDIVNADLTELNTFKLDLLEDAQLFKSSLAGTIQAFARVVEARDPYTAGHQSRVADLAVAIARQMQLDNFIIEGIQMGAVIHDIGKVHLPAEILSKPTKLTDMEFELIKTHPGVGYEILKDVRFPWPVADIVLQHHERIDGSGYPNGLKGDDICLQARIVAVADVVEAINSFRPYRAAMGIDRALDEVRLYKGTRYDPAVVVACLEIFAANIFSFDQKQGGAFQKL